MIIAILRVVVFFTKRRGYRTIAGMSTLFAEKTIEGRVIGGVIGGVLRGLTGDWIGFYADPQKTSRRGCTSGVSDRAAVFWVVGRVTAPGGYPDRTAWFCPLRGSV